jgi:S-DNA-T family DNA segregation ATPase FtsK/SpoIIIE
VRRAEPALRTAVADDDPAPEPEERGGFLSRMPGLLRKPTPLPDPELIETEGYQGETDPPEQDRIKAQASAFLDTL